MANSGQPKQLLKAHGVLSKLKNIKISPKKKSLLEGSVFYELCRVSKARECSSTLILALRSFLDLSTRTFRLNPDTTLKLCPKEVAMVLGMEDHGKDFIKDKLDQQAVFPSSLFHLRNKLDGERTESLTVMDIRKMLSDMPVEDEESKILFKKLLIYYIIDQFLFASKGKKVRVKFWPVVDDLDQLETYNWPKATLDFIFEELQSIEATKEAMKKGQTIGSPIQVLETVVYERVQKIRPKVLPNNPPLQKYKSCRKSVSEWQNILKDLKSEDIQICVYCAIEAGTSACAIEAGTSAGISKDLEQLRLCKDVEGDEGEEKGDQGEEWWNHTGIDTPDTLEDPVFNPMRKKRRSMPRSKRVPQAWIGEPVESITQADAAIEPVDSITRADAAIESVENITRADAAIKPVESINQADAAIEPVESLTRAAAAIESVNSNTQTDAAAIEPVENITQADAAIKPVENINQADAAIEPVESLTRADAAIESVNSNTQTDAAAIEPVERLTRADAVILPVESIMQADVVIEPVKSITRADAAIGTPLNELKVESDAEGRIPTNTAGNRNELRNGDENVDDYTTEIPGMALEARIAAIEKAIAKLKAAKGLKTT